MRALAITTVLFAVLIHLGAAAGPAEKPNPIEARSEITQVTVYSDRALVTRSWEQTLAPGRSLLKIANLPDLLLDESVRVAGKGDAAARILDIKVKNEKLEDAASPRIMELETRQRELEKQLRTLNDRLELLSRKERFLKSVLGGDQTGASEFQKKGVLEWDRAVRFLESNLTGIQVERRRLEEESRTILDKKSVADHELAQQAQLRGRERKSVWIEMETREAGRFRIDVSYLVPRASWTPAYDLRFETASKEAGLTYQALVRQETGEDWENARLTLSTAKPASDNQPPSLRPQDLDQPMSVAEAAAGTDSISGTVMDPDGSPIPGVLVNLLSGPSPLKKFISDESGRFRFGGLIPGAYGLACSLEGFQPYRQTGLYLMNGRSLDARVVMKPAPITESVVVTGAAPLLDSSRAGKTFTVSPNQPPPAESGGSSRSSSSSATPAWLPAEPEPAPAPASIQLVAVTFPIEQTETVLSNNAPQKVTIAVDSLSCEREYLAVPKLDEQTYLKATATNGGSFPLLPGKASVFYDGSFVSTADIPAVSINEKFPVPIGAESGIKVKWERLPRKTDEAGLLRKRIERVFEYRITVENFHPTSETVSIEDQIPVSENKEIRIQLLGAVPEPKKPEEDDAEREKNQGILRWELELKPREKREIRFSYSVSYPKKQPVFNLD